jgi:hypothetical protein
MVSSWLSARSYRHTSDVAITGDTELPTDSSGGENIHDPSSPGPVLHRQSADPVLPHPLSNEPSSDEPSSDERSSDERELGWGDRPAGYDDEWYLDQRPPHHE